MSVALSDDDTRGFSASKDGTILHWDVSSGEKEIYKWPSDETLKSHGMKVREPRNKKHSRATLALAVSSDGRYLATGGVDRHIHIWDVRTREHVQVIMIRSRFFCFVVVVLLSASYNHVSTGLSRSQEYSFVSMFQKRVYGALFRFV